MNLLELRATLHAYRDFEECIVRDLRWSAYGTTIEIDVDYIWRQDGSVRGSADDRVVVTMRFCMVQELRMRNRLNSSQVEKPERIDWGLNEVANVEVSEVSDPAYRELPRKFYCITFFWEKAAWIEVTFADLELSERTVASRKAM